MDVDTQQSSAETVQPTSAAENAPIHLLVAVAQTFSLQEKKLLLARIAACLSQVEQADKNIREEIATAIKAQSFDAYLPDQEYKIVYRNEKSVDLQLLINASLKTFKGALKNLLSANCKQRYFVNATLDLNSNGDLNLQDGQFSCDDLLLLLADDELKQHKEAIESSQIKLFLTPKNIDSNKSWKALSKSYKNVQVVSQASLSEAPEDAWQSVISGLAAFLNERPVEQMMETSKFTGTLRIHKPILYIFPALEGDSAFFTINGYSMLINGGYDRVRPCFWKFVNMLQQIDSVLITHTDCDALGGLSSFFAKKLLDADVKPTVLTVLGNLITSSAKADPVKSLAETNGTASPSTKGAATAASLIVSEIAAAKPTSALSDTELILEAIERLKIKLMPLVKGEAPSKSHAKPEHINLYYKLGQGSLDLYVLSPFANSADYKEFVHLQQSHAAKLTHHKSQLSVNQIFRQIPSSHLCSAVVLLVWSPASSSREPSTALRLLFTGNAPQHVVLSALEKAKDMEVLSVPAYKIKSADTHQAPPPPVVIKKAPVEKASASTANQANTSINMGKAVLQPNPKAAPVAANGAFSAEPAVKQNAHSRVSNIHPNSAKDVSTKTQEKPVEKAAPGPKPPKPATATTNGVAKDATSAPNVKKPAGASHEAKKKPAAKEAAKENKEEEKEDKPAKEEVKTFAAKPASTLSNKSSTSTNPKEAKQTRSDTNTATVAAKPTSAPSASKSDTQTAKPASAPSKPNTNTKPPAAPKVASSTSAPSKEVGKKPTAKKDEVKKEPKEPHESKILGKKNAKVQEAAKPEVKPSAEPEVTAEAKQETTVQEASKPAEEIVTEPTPNVPKVLTESVLSNDIQVLVETTKEEAKVESSKQDEEEAQIDGVIDTTDVRNFVFYEEAPSKELLIDEEEDAQEEEEEEEEKVIEPVSSNMVELQEDSQEAPEVAREAEAEQEEKKLEDICEEANSKELLLEAYDSSNTVKTSSANYDEWPNLSPVKKEQSGGDLMDVAGEELNGVENRDSSAIEAPEELEQSEDDSQIRPPANLPLLTKNDCSENMVISDSRDLIASPIACDSHAEKSFEAHDIMTRSFIDDGSQSNPFAAPTSSDEAAVKVHKQSRDDSDINDLNKTHELFADESQEEVADVSHQEAEEDAEL